MPKRPGPFSLGGGQQPLAMTVGKVTARVRGGKFTTPTPAGASPAPSIVAGQTLSISEAASIGAVVGMVPYTGGPPTSASINSGNTGTKFAISSVGVITVIGACVSMPYSSME